MGELVINGHEVEAFLDRQDVLVIAEESFGDYQGDRVFLIHNTHPETAAYVGVIVAGYGSCSYCCQFEGAEDEGPQAVAELAESLINSATYFSSIYDIAFYLLGPNAALQWYFHTQGFEDAVRNLLETLHRLLPGFPVGGNGNMGDFVKTQQAIEQ